MNIWITFLIIAFSVLGHADAIPESKCFVWAQSGLNIRQAPSTKSKIIEKIPFGDSLIVIEESDISYNITGIHKVDSTQYYYSRFERKAPYILYGKWVKVKTSSGNIGFTVNQYLLPIKNYKNEYIQLKVLETDTIISKNTGYESKYLSKKYNDNIQSYESINEKYYEEVFIFNNLTMQQVFVLIISNNEELSNITVTQNWKKTLAFKGAMCDFRLTQLNGYLKLEYFCSC